MLEHLERQETDPEARLAQHGYLVHQLDLLWEEQYAQCCTAYVVKQTESGMHTLTRSWSIGILHEYALSSNVVETDNTTVRNDLDTQVQCTLPFTGLKAADVHSAWEQMLTESWQHVSQHVASGVSVTLLCASFLCRCREWSGPPDSFTAVPQQLPSCSEGLSLASHHQRNPTAPRNPIPA